MSTSWRYFNFLLKITTKYSPIVRAILRLSEITSKFDSQMELPRLAADE